MSRYEDAFEQLSERGQPVGSDGLVQMLGNPDFLVSIEPESPRRLVGPVRGCGHGSWGRGPRIRAVVRCR